MFWTQCDLFDHSGSNCSQVDMRGFPIRLVFDSLWGHYYWMLLQSLEMAFGCKLCIGPCTTRGEVCLFNCAYVMYLEDELDSSLLSFMIPVKMISAFSCCRASTMMHFMRDWHSMRKKILRKSKHRPTRLSRWAQPLQIFLWYRAGSISCQFTHSRCLQIFNL